MIENVNGTMIDEAQKLIDWLNSLATPHEEWPEGHLPEDDDGAVNRFPGVGNIVHHVDENFYPSNNSGPCCHKAKFVASKKLFYIGRRWSNQSILTFIMESYVQHMNRCPITNRVLILTEFWDSGVMDNYVPIIRKHRNQNKLIEVYLSANNRPIRVL